MRFILLGPPGAGKGTHAKVLCEKFGLAHLAAGDILRRNIREGTELGKKAKDVIEKGELVSDDLVNQMMFDEIKALAGGKGLVLDGYPRTIGQAKALDQFIAQQQMKIDAAMNFDTSEEVVIERLSGRRVCPKCNANYHIRNIPPKKEGICDHCGSALTQRKDDTPETIRHRLETYHKETEPLIEYYRRKGELHSLHGDYEIEQLQKEIASLFERLQLAV